MKIFKQYLINFLSFAVFIFLTACQTIPAQNVADTNEQALDINLPDDTAQFRLRDPFVKVGIEALENKEYNTASSAFNHALKLEPKNPYLHFLNALTYHLMTYQGDISKADLALVGYNLSRQFDDAAWWTEYFNGLLALQENQYAQAQAYFARALLFNESNIEIMKGLITSSYYLGDLASAQQILSYALEQSENDVELLRSASLVYAALGDNSKAQNYLRQYSQLSLPDYKIEFLAKRVNDWSHFHKQGLNNFISVADMDSGSDGDNTMDNDSEAMDDSIQTNKSNRQVVVDVVIIRSEERATDRRGINLLNGLSITFGLSDVRSSTELGLATPNAVTATGGEVDFNTFAFPSVFTRTLSIPSVTYSLNIFNTIDDRNEVIAKPSLMALDGEKSSFFSGAELSIGFAGTLQGGNLEDKEVGVTLDVTPEFITDTQVKLTVKAERDFFEDFSPGSFDQSVQTSKNVVTANAVMEFGQTLVLSGLTEKETESLEDKVPVLGDIPLLKTFFNETREVEFDKSILFMLTPRKVTFVEDNQDTSLDEDVDNAAYIKRILSQWQTSTNSDAKNDKQVVSVEPGIIQNYVRVSDLNYKGWNNTANIKTAINSAVQRLYD